MKIAVLTIGRMKDLIVRFLENDKSVSEIKVYTDEDDFKPTDEYLIISTGNMKLRREVWEKYKEHSFINIVQTSTPPEKIGKGNFIFPSVFCDWFTEIGDNNIISAGTIISHHCKIGNSILFGPGCLLSGSVTIGNNCTFGSGVIFQPYVNIADNTTIPSGCVVVGNVEGAIIAKKRGSIYTGEYLHSSHNLT